jgi:outer membrane murein-binding lipoprotein Lpp
MKRLFIAVIVLLLFISGCSNSKSSDWSGITSTSQENVKEVNALVQDLMANSQQMDFQVEPSRADWVPEGLAQIRKMAFDLIPTIKIIGKTNKKTDLHRSGMAFFRWSDVTIYIDLKAPDPDNIYIESAYGTHKAAASKKSIENIIAFAKKSLLLK